MTFEHQLSKLYLTLIPGANVTQEQLVNVTVKVIGMFTTGTYNIRTKQIIPATTGDISMKVASRSTAASAEAILIPQCDGVPNVKLRFTLVDDSATFETDLTNALSAGMNHNYRITIDLPEPATN